MGFSEPPSRTRGRTRPVPAVTAGVRKRGRSGKLTPFIAIQEATVIQHFFVGSDKSDSLPMTLLVGNGADSGKIGIQRSPEANANITLRRPAAGSTEFIIESTMIPFFGGKAIPRKETQFEFVSNGMIITLPWAQPKLKGEL